MQKVGKEQFKQVAEQCGHNVKSIMAATGLSRSNVFYRLKQLNGNGDNKNKIDIAIGEGGKT